MNAPSFIALAGQELWRSLGMLSATEEKIRRLHITCSLACKRGTETIRRCYRKGRSKHRDSWRVPGTGEEWEGVRLGIHWILCAVTLITALPLFSLGWTAGNWVMLPQLLAVCAQAQGEAAARPGREHMGWCNVDKWKFYPVQAVRTEGKVWACNVVRHTPNDIQYVCFKYLSPKNIAFLKHTII